MADFTIQRDYIKGLEASLSDLQGKKDVFSKAKGLDEEAEKMRADVVKLQDNLAVEKLNLKTLVEVKNTAMMGVTAAMAKTMNGLLAGTTSIIEINEAGEVFIGMFNGKKNVPYSGLSGGEKASFEPALCRALGGSILLVEAAELDPKRLTAALEKYGQSDLQVVVSTFHAPEAAVPGWETVRL